MPKLPGKATASTDAAAATRRFDAALTAAGFGRYQCTLAVVPCSMLTSNSMIVVLLSLLRTKAAATLGRSTAEVAAAETLIPLVTLLGMLAGAPAFGWLSDHHGRRLATIVCGVCICVGLLIIAASPTLSVLYTGNILCGVASGGLHVGQTLLAEFVPHTHRGHIIAAYASFWTTGMLCMSLWYALVAGTALGSWRNLALFVAIPNALAALYAYLRLPESPRYLLTVGRHRCADQVLTDMATANGNAAATAAVFSEHDDDDGEEDESCQYGATSKRGDAAACPNPPREDVDDAEIGAAATTTGTNTSGGGLTGGERLGMLLSVPSLRGVTLRLWAMWAAGTVVYFAVVLVAPDVGRRSADATTTARHSSSAAAAAAAAGAADEASARWLVLQAVAEYPSYGLQFAVGHLLSRRVGMSLCAVLAGAAGVLWVFVTSTLHDATGANICAFILFRVMLLTFYNLLWLVTPEAYPTMLRSTGSGACAAVSGVAGAMAPFVLLMPAPALFVGAAATFAACFGSAWTLPNETAGRPLADGVHHDHHDVADDADDARAR